MKSNHLDIIPYGGLGNRLRVLSSALSLTNNSNTVLNLYWFKKKELNEDFHTLFGNPERTHLIDKGFKYSLYKILLKHIYINKYSRLYRFMLNLFYDHIIFDTNIDSVNAISLNNEEPQRILIATCYDFTLNFDIDNIKLSDYMQKKVYRECINLGDITAMIGVHVRRTDHIALIEQSPLSKYFYHIDKIISQQNNIKFYLCTDDDAVKKTFKERYPNKIKTRDIELNRNSANGIQEAVIDLYTLAQTKAIIANSDSSFALIASQIGHKKDIIEAI